MVVFSVIIPAKNEEANIGRCLESVLKLEGVKTEVIVVDNGSSDLTVSIAENYGAKVFIRPDLTISGLRNFGAENAKGDFLAFVDADCEVASDWLKNSLPYFKNNIAAVGSMAVPPEGGGWVERAWGRFRTRRAKITQVDWLNSMNLIVSKSAFQRVGGFDESLKTCEDVDLCYRLRKHYSIISVPSVKVIHHGEAKTLKIFFLKELWRGQSNIKGIINHGIVAREIPSFLLPFWLIVCFFMFILLPFYFAQIGPFLILLILLPSVAFSLWASWSIKSIEHFFHYIILFFVYSFARTCSLFINKIR